jgi:hypothetical protein
MKQHSNEEIENTRNHFNSLGLEEVNITLKDGTAFSYYVMPQTFNSNLPHFVFQCANKGQGVFGISDSVPQEFRRYAVAHEVYESRGSPIIVCSGALEKELELIEEDFGSITVLRSYLELRRDFFENLVNYAKNNGQDCTQFQESLQYLQRVLFVSAFRLRGDSR